MTAAAPAHRSPLRLAVAVLAACAPALRAQNDFVPLDLNEASIADLQGAIQSGLVTVEGLVERYRARIAAYDRAGPTLSSVLVENREVVVEARARDRDLAGGATPGPLFGIPVLLKDNVDALPMATAAGNVALQASFPPDDAFLTRRLRDAGAVVVGKANLTEFANFMTVGMPNGYSSLGGFTINPYDPRTGPSGQGIADTGGSSSGSAVAVAANLVTVAIGTETSGSILSPAGRNAVVGIKPTVGLVSRDGILPITADQDTAGPIARTVEDAARVLGVIAGFDPNDPATAACNTPGNCFSDYTQFLDRGALRGARIFAPPLLFSLNPSQRAVYDAAIAQLRAAGATVETSGQTPGRSLPPFELGYPATPGRSTVLIYGFKRDLETYLQGLGPGAPRSSLAAIIAYNNVNARVALRFGQSILVAADQYDTTPGGADEMRYLADRQNDLNIARGDLDAAFAGPDGQSGTVDDFDAILSVYSFGSIAPARAGYPSLSVPAGFYQAGSNNPPLPLGITFTGPAFSEPRLIALGYAYEQATRHRRSPSSTPALPTDTIPLGNAGVRTIGQGCAGAAGTPTISTSGPAIIGNGAFGLRIDSLQANTTAFAGFSDRQGLSIIGRCFVRIPFPFALVATTTADASGVARIDVPLPWDPALVGTSFFTQGGGLEIGGPAAGVGVFSGALEVTLGG